MSDDTRVTSVELHKQLGRTIDQARIAPVIVTKHDRDHVVIVSAEQYAVMAAALRQVRRTGSLSEAERAAVAAAEVPDEAVQRRYLAALAAGIEPQP